jgi:hypothetical protein
MSLHSSGSVFSQQKFCGGQIRKPAGHQSPCCGRRRLRGEFSERRDQGLAPHVVRESSQAREADLGSLICKDIEPRERDSVPAHQRSAGTRGISDPGRTLAEPAPTLLRELNAVFQCGRLDHFYAASRTASVKSVI